MNAMILFIFYTSRKIALNVVSSDNYVYYETYFVQFETGQLCDDNDIYDFMVYISNLWIVFSSCFAYYSHLNYSLLSTLFVETSRVKLFSTGLIVLYGSSRTVAKYIKIIIRGCNVISVTKVIFMSVCLQWCWIHYFMVKHSRLCGRLRPNMTLKLGNKKAASLAILNSYHIVTFLHILCLFFIYIHTNLLTLIWETGWER
jgi:hypothetical protein